MGIKDDPDFRKSMAAIAAGNLAALHQIDPIMTDVTQDQLGNIVDTRVDLDVGIYKFNLFGLLPIAIRITDQPNDRWYDNRQGEIIRFFQEPLIRVVNSGDVVLWRPIFDFEPYPELNIVLLARPETYGG